MNDKIVPPRGTTAHKPDLNWSQVRETVLMLELAAQQIEHAMKDSNSSVDVLTCSFTAMADCMQEILDRVETLPGDGVAGETRDRLLETSANVAGMVRQAVIAFQFYDKLVQRLAHVGLSLGELSDLVGEPARLYNPGEWVALQNRIRAKYSTREEIAMFDAVMNGIPVHEAIERFMNEMRERDDDVELF